jgi:uncharacterized phage-associated protein
MKYIYYYFLSLFLVSSPYICAMDICAVESLSQSSSEFNNEGKRERDEETEFAPLSPVLKKTKEIDEQAHPHQAVQVAAYLLQLDEQETRTHKFIDRLKLQKLLYYIQGYSLALYNRPMFSEKVIRYNRGPVVWEVMTLLDRGYKERVHRRDLETQGFQEAVFTEDEKNLIKNVFRLKLQKSGEDLEADSHEERPYKKTDWNKEMNKALLERFFREPEPWLAWIIDRFCATTTNDDFENLMRYAREHLSYSCLDDLSLEKIVSSFNRSKEAIEKTLEIWSGIVAVRWPGQTHYEAFMGYLFLPVQYELNYETVRSDVLQPLTCISASFGNALALHYTIELLDIYSLEEETSIEEKNEVKDARSALSFCLNLGDGPLYHIGLLNMCVSKSKRANELFKKGFDEKGNRWCGYRHALLTRNRELRKQVIQKLRAIDQVLADVAGESSIEDTAERIALHKKCAEAGFARSYITAGTLLEESDVEEAQKMYLLAARHHILSGYEKLAELVIRSGNEQTKQTLKKIYRAWGIAGDPLGYIKLGELFLEEDNKQEAMTCFGLAGIKGIEKKIEHASTYEEGEAVKQGLQVELKEQYDYVEAKLTTGTAVLKREL